MLITHIHILPSSTVRHLRPWSDAKSLCLAKNDLTSYFIQISIIISDDDCTLMRSKSTHLEWLVTLECQHIKK